MNHDHNSAVQPRWSKLSFYMGFEKKLLPKSSTLNRQPSPSPSPSTFTGLMEAVVLVMGHSIFNILCLSVAINLQHSPFKPFILEIVRRDLQHSTFTKKFSRIAHPWVQPGSGGGRGGGKKWEVIRKKRRSRHQRSCFGWFLLSPCCQQRDAMATTSCRRTSNSINSTETETSTNESTILWRLRIPALLQQFGSSAER